VRSGVTDVAAGPGQVVWRPVLIIGAAVAALATVAMIYTIDQTVVPPPGTVRSYTSTFSTPQSPVEVVLVRADGQAYGALALDPTLAHPEVFTNGPQWASYFARRPVLPALLWAGTGGDRALLPVAVTVVNALGLGLLAAAAVALVQVRGRGQDDRLAILVVLVPAVVMHFLNPAVEALAFGLAGFGLVLWTRANPNRVVAAVLFALAALTRETMMIVPAVLAVEALVRHRARFRDLALLLMTPVAYVAWGAVVRSRFGSLGANGTVGAPLQGFLVALPYWTLEDWILLVLLGAVSIAAVLKDHRSTLAHLIMAYWAFAAVMSELVWEDWTFFSRLLLPAVIFAVVILIPDVRLESRAGRADDPTTSDLRPLV
jgi:hypothetical protein